MAAPRLPGALLALGLAIAATLANHNEEHKQYVEMMQKCAKDAGMTNEHVSTCHIKPPPEFVKFKTCVLRHSQMVTKDGGYDRDKHLRECNKMVEAAQDPQEKQALKNHCSLCMDEIKGKKGRAQMVALCQCECVIMNKMMEARQRQQQQQQQRGGGGGGGRRRGQEIPECQRKEAEIARKCWQESGAQPDDLDTCEEDPSDAAMDFFTCKMREEGLLTDDERFSMAGAKKKCDRFCKECKKNKEECASYEEFVMECPKKVRKMQGDELIRAFTMCEGRYLNEARRRYQQQQQQQQQW